ncbi:unnamed protein product, partial [Prorocentrum cordatum]
ARACVDVTELQAALGAMRRWVVMATAADVCPLIGWHRTGKPHRCRRVLPVAQALAEAGPVVGAAEGRAASGAGRAAPPFTPDIAASMSSLVAGANALDLSCLLLISLEGLRRGGEACALTAKDVLGPSTQSCCESRRPGPHQANGTAEAVAIRSAVAETRLRLAAQQGPLGEALSRGHPRSSQARSGPSRTAGGLPGTSRGSPPDEEAPQTFPVVATLARSRWACSVAARIYIESAGPTPLVCD